MKKGTIVSWRLHRLATPGRGTVIADEDDTGHVPVAVESLDGGPNPGYHPVIWCTVTWLTVVEAPAAQEAVSAPLTNPALTPFNPGPPGLQAP